MYMARPFSPADARSLLAGHRRTFNNLESLLDMREKARTAVFEAARNAVAQEVLAILREIPIEEINRDKVGIRVKALRAYGYTTIADIVAASVYNISSINGISADGAYFIKKRAKELADQASVGVKIRLSTDRKTAHSTKLVLAIAKYRAFSETALQAEQLLLNRDSILLRMEELRPATNFLRWLFTSSEKKEKAVEAYETLRTSLFGKYGEDAAQITHFSENIIRMAEDAAWDDFSENPVRFFNVLEEIAPDVLGTDDAVYGLPEELAREIQDQCFFPEGLLCELRRYQEWGVKYILHQERVLLGDEMGLGKTVQAIAAMVSLRNTGATHFMVVCPASVLENWCREIRKHSLLRAIKIHGQGRKLAFEEWKRVGGVAVTSYETTGIFTFNESERYTLLVVDEAHYIKNPEARRTVNVKHACEFADRLLFMTGTALENKVDEMIALIEVLRPDVANSVRRIASIASAPQFREKVAPVYYRRKREDVLTELPEKAEILEWCSLLPEEERLYESAVLGKRYTDARRVSWIVDDYAVSSKAIRMRELIEEAASEGRKVLVFSYFLETIRKIGYFLGDSCMGPINGSVSPQRRQQIIDEFDKAPAGTVLVAQINSGGVGLNIQSASVVILCEPQFKPSSENQAISRVYRMGQTRNVLVYRLLCENTVDEKILALLEEKQAVFDAFADKSVAAQESIEIDDKSFGDIIKEEIDRINRKNGTAPPADM